MSSFFHSNIFHNSSLNLSKFSDNDVVHSIVTVCRSWEKWLVFKIAKNEINVILSWLPILKQEYAVFMVVKLFFFYKDVDKFCNSLAELYSNVSKVGDFSSVNTCIMNKLYLNVPLRAATGSYINFIWKKRFFMIAT